MPYQDRATQIVPFTITSQAQVDFLMRQTWPDGSWGRQWRHEVRVRSINPIGATYNVFVWKIEALKAAVPRHRSPDTWLKEPYKPGRWVTPANLP